jgi:hypothetical protein
VLKGLKRHAIVALLLYLALVASLPIAMAEFEVRQELRSDGLLYNNEFILLPITSTLFHQENLAATDTEAFAFSPLTSAAGGGFALGQTSDRTIAATQTGFFEVIIPYELIEEYPGEIIGNGLNWVANAEPITFAGLPQNTMMIFPSMAEIIRIPNGTGNGTDSYTINANNSIPYYPGNMMLAKNVTNEQGENETVLEPVPRDYMTLIASQEEVANRTIMERMWRDVHLKYNLDRAYVGETCYPDLIYPIRETYTLMTFIPDNTSIRDALKIIRPGERLRRIFWPVGA